MLPYEKKIRDGIVEETLIQRIGEELEPVDMEQRVRDMLDECYGDAFRNLGGPFTHMIPSRILELDDPVAFRCMVADEGDADDLAEFNGEYYDKKAFEDLKEEIEDEVDTGIDEDPKWFSRYCER